MVESSSQLLETERTVSIVTFISLNNVDGTLQNNEDFHVNLLTCIFTYHFTLYTNEYWMKSKCARLKLQIRNDFLLKAMWLKQCQIRENSLNMEGTSRSLLICSRVLIFGMMVVRQTLHSAFNKT